MISKLQYRGEKEDTAARTCDRKDGGTLLPGLATGRMGDTAAGPLRQEGFGTLPGRAIRKKTSFSFSFLKVFSVQHLL